MTTDERNEKLWQAALAAMTGLRASMPSDYSAPWIAERAMFDARALVAEYERETGGGK